MGESLLVNWVSYSRLRLDRGLCSRSLRQHLYPQGRLQDSSQRYSIVCGCGMQGTLSNDMQDDQGVRVLARFKVNKLDCVSVFKATTKEDFKDVVKLLPENTPLPASNKMTYDSTTSYSLAGERCPLHGPSCCFPPFLLALLLLVGPSRSCVPPWQHCPHVDALNFRPAQGRSYEGLRLIDWGCSTGT